MVTLVRSLRILKLQDPVRLSISYTQERLSRLKKRSRLHRRFSVGLTATFPSIFICETFILFSLNDIETCQRCGHMSSNPLCKACTLLEGLERGMADSGIVSNIRLICRYHIPDTKTFVCSSRQIEGGGNVMRKVPLQKVYERYLTSSRLRVVLQ